MKNKLKRWTKKHGAVRAAEKAVERIRTRAFDDEGAHEMEDEFHRWVLRQIAAGHPDPTRLAAIALSTREISFARWCG